jgi:integrase
MKNPIIPTMETIMAKTERAFPGVWRRIGDSVWQIQINRTDCGRRVRHNFGGFSNAKSTSRLRENVCRDLERHNAGEVVNTKGYPKRRLEILQMLGVIQADQSRTSNLHDLIDEYEEVLKARGNTSDHIQRTKHRITVVVDAAKLSTIQHINAASASKIQIAISKIDVGPTTRNHHLRAVKSFCKWLFDTDRIPSDPTRRLKPVNAEEKAVKRRVLSDAEFERLLESLPQSESRHRRGLAERRIIYLIARWTGLRAAEVASLRPSSFELDGATPVAVIPVTISKRRKEDRQPIPSFLVPELREFIAGKPVNDRLFPGKWYRRAAEMLRPDLEAAGIPYETHAGQADFHALRHTYISNLASKGVKPKALQTLARHSTITLTLEHYTHLDEADVAAELNAAVGG